MPMGLAQANVKAVPVPRPMIISLRTEPLTADALAGGLLLTRMRDVNGAADETISYKKFFLI